MAKEDHAALLPLPSFLWRRKRIEWKEEEEEGAREEYYLGRERDSPNSSFSLFYSIKVKAKGILESQKYT